MTIKLGINGFGRIGKIAFLQAIRNPNFTVVAINARRTPQNIVDILKYDTNYGRFKYHISCDENNIYVEGKPIRILTHDNPKDIPWGEVGVDTVLECTGKFLKTEDASGHLVGGAKKVVISAPAKSDDIPTFVYGVNEGTYTDDMNIVSSASCTTNAIAPVLKVINDNFGIEAGSMITVHAMTGSQAVVDSFSKKDIRAGRTASTNLIPATTGASKAIKKVIPELKGKLSGTSMRTPVPTVSYAYISCTLKKEATFEEVCQKIIEASEKELRGILNYTNDPVVSSDFIEDDHASIVDVEISKQAMGDLSPESAKHFISVATWYDNEWGYVAQMLRLTMHINGLDEATALGYYRCLNSTM